MSTPAALAGRVRSAVTAEHPTVGVEQWAEAHGEVVHFVPPNADGASVTVTVGDSVIVEAMLFREDLDGEGTLSEQTLVATRIVLSFADNGMTRVRSWAGRFPYFETVYGPSAGYWGVDEYARGLIRTASQVLGPWENTRSVGLLD